MKKIPLLKVHVSRNAARPLLKVLYSGFIGQGKFVDDFEKKIAAFLKVDPDCVVTTNSCTSALRLALRLSGAIPGTTVISTPATNLSTNSTILDAGAKIIWSDISPLTGHLRADLAEEKVRVNTQAVMLMDWAGQPGDLKDFVSRFRRRGIAIIEDAAQSFGSTYDGQHLSHYADFVCHSFGAVKQINTGGHGGVLICRRRKDADRARLLRWFGLDRRETSSDDPRCEQVDVSAYGYQMQMNDLSAVIGLANLREAPELLERARSNARFYELAFKSTLIRPVDLQPNRIWSPWVFTVLLPNAAGRNKVLTRMRRRGIGCSKVHARNDFHSTFREFTSYLPGVDQFYETMLSIPVGSWVSTSDREIIAAALIEETKKAYANA